MGLTPDVLDVEVASEEVTFTPDLNHIPFSKSRLGWCNDGNHVRCPAIVGGTPWPDPAAKHRTIPNPARRCPCECHSRTLD